jgi:hypothetical protein
MSLTVITQVLAIVIITGWLVYKEVHERGKSRDYGLLENPERCKDHEERLRQIEKDCAATTTQLAVLTVEVRGVKDRMDNIADVFNRAGGDHI